MRRLLIALTTLFLLTACIGDDMNDKDDESSARPTARTQSDGVEVWDLRGTPSAAAFGIDEGRPVGVYESEEPRQVRFELPGGKELTLDIVLLTFERFGEGDDARFSVGIRTPQLKPERLVPAFRDVLDQLSVPTEPADQLAAEIDAAPSDQTERISVGSEAATLDGLQISAQAGLAPIAGSGRVIVGGSWRQD